jgi:uncharacterized coiled-coil protein SlyX
MSEFRIDRTLLIETDQDNVDATRVPLTSIRQAGWQHQALAASQGYNSMAEFAIDELLTLVGEQQQRIERLERQMAGLADSIQTLHAQQQIVAPDRP